MRVQERQASVRARRKQRGRRLMTAYALCGVIFLRPALMMVLMVCGVLSIRECLAPAPASKLPDGNEVTIWRLSEETGEGRWKALHLFLVCAANGYRLKG